jgi:hypothetical protein
MVPGAGLLVARPDFCCLALPASTTVLLLMFGELPVTLANPLVNESFSATVGWKARTIKYNLVILI